MVEIQLPVQSVPINTNIVSSNPAHGEVYLIHHYVIKFVSDLRQVGGSEAINQRTDNTMTKRKRTKHYTVN
jgi:hypothetical protein